MVRAHECPDCERRFSGAICPSCGWTPPRAKPVELPTCAWETDGKRCVLLATVWLGLHAHRDAHGDLTRPGHCGWHALCRDSPARADDFDEFERWQFQLLEHGYCNQFTHHRASYVWEALRGHWQPDAERERVKPCGAATCCVHDLNPAHGKPAPPAQAKNFIRALTAKLVAQVRV